ncbi:MAG: Flp family type IVb pilin [Alteraurantiacibacter sp.]
MLKMILRRILSDARGTTAIEYGLVAMLVGVALVGVMLSLGSEVDKQYDTVSTDYAAAANGKKPAGSSGG